MVGWYYNGSTNDQSGNGNNLTAIDITTTNGIDGNANSAFYFNGKSSFLTVGNLPVPSNNAFTWSVWVQTPSISSESFIMDMASQIPDEKVTPALSFSQTSAGSSFQDLLSFGSFSYTSGGWVINSSSNPIHLSQWNQIIATSDTNGIRNLYVNGSLVSQGLTLDYGQQLERLYIGAYGVATPMFFFNGAMTDIRIYNTTLSSNQASTLYSLESVPEPSDYALFGIGLIALTIVYLPKKTA